MDDKFEEDTKATLQKVREQLKEDHPDLPSTQKFCDIASDSLIGAVIMSKLAENGGALRSCMCIAKDEAYFLEKTVYQILAKMELDEIHIVTADCFEALKNSKGVRVVYALLMDSPEPPTKKLLTEAPEIVLAEGASVLKMK